MKTILLLVCSDTFMTVAWYGHLKFKWLDGKSVLTVILVSWGIAFFEYCLMVPANRGGHLSGEFSGYQVKIIQECVTLAVFVGFARLVLKEKLSWNYAVSFALIVLAVWFAVAFKTGSGTPPHWVSARRGPA
ncbi:MAG: DMT family protein [Opitutus sp.]